MLNVLTLGVVGVCAFIAGAVYSWRGALALARALKGQGSRLATWPLLVGLALLVGGAFAICNPYTGLGFRQLGMVIGGFGGMMAVYLLRQVAFDVFWNLRHVLRGDRQVLGRWAALAASSAGLVLAGLVLHFGLGALLGA